MRIRAVTILCVLAFAFPATLGAQEAIFELDSAKTVVEFTLGDVLHTVNGTFKAKTGRVEFDAGSGDASGAFVIDTTTGDSGNRTRDHKMHKEILESDKYPEASFTPTHVTGAILPDGGSTLQVQGIFRLHGTDHEMTLSVPVQVSGSSLAAKLHFAVPYVDWGMKDPSNFLLRVSKQVEINITAAGRYQPPKRQ